MKIGIFGGSFNPVHNGHIKLCEHCLSANQMDKLILIPDNIPPHKAMAEFATGAQRLSMLKLATTKLLDVEISDIELQMGGVSYTVNTIKKLKECYPSDEFYLIIGTDMFLSFKQWYQYEEILSFCFLYVAAREQDDFSKLKSFQQTFGQWKQKIFIAQNKVLELSSTEVRAALKQGKGQEMLPKAVYEYICKNNLYAVKR